LFRTRKSTEKLHQQISQTLNTNTQYTRASNAEDIKFTEGIKSVKFFYILIFAIIPTAAAGVARSPLLSSSLPLQAVQYVMQAVLTSHRPFHLYPSVNQDRTPCWVDSLRPHRSLWS
jgi:hypothetical protein